MILGSKSRIRMPLASAPRLIVFVCMAALLLSACQTKTTRPPPPPAEDPEQPLLEGDFRRAAELFANRARQDRVGAKRLWLRAAEAWREEGDLEAMRSALDALAAARGDALTDLEQRRLELLLAEIALAEGDGARALMLLAAPASQFPRTLRPRLHELRARAFELERNWPQAARERARLLPLTREEDGAVVREQIRAALERMPLDERRALLAELPPGDPLRLVIGEAPRLEPSSETIVLLVHDAGPLSSASQLVADGFLASHFQSGRRGKLRLVSVGTTAEEVLGVVRRLSPSDAALVVGPLAREAVRALWAEPFLPVPVLALNDAGLPPVGHLSFALPPEQDGSFLGVELLARGVDDVALLFAQEEAAERAAMAFAETFRHGGGRVRAEASLDPHATDHREPIRVALDAALARRRAETLQRALGLRIHVAERHRADLDALVLIARPHLARLVATQVRLFTEGELPLAGTAMLHDGRRSLEDRDLDGLFFCDAPWMLDLGGPPPSRAELPSLQENGPEQRLFLFGMDAERIARAWLESGAPPTGLQGGSGLLSVGADGRVHRRLECAVFDKSLPSLLRSPANWP